MTGEVQELPGVRGVCDVLEAGAVTVTSGQEIDDAADKAAVEEAGYQLA